MDKEVYWNSEEDDEIICPYCGEHYEPTYDETIIGDKCVNCYTEDTEIYICDCCKKRFTMYGYQAGWKYVTETIDGEMSQIEHDENW